jgi:hypothetical protein
MPVGSDPDKRSHAHYRWAKRYAVERDELASLAHLRRAIYYTTSGQRFGHGKQRFGGKKIPEGVNLFFIWFVWHLSARHASTRRQAVTEAQTRVHRAHASDLTDG